MPIPDFRDFLKGDLFGHRTTTAARPQSAVCEDARLRVQDGPLGLEFHCTHPEMLLLTVDARLEGPITVARERSDDGLPLARLAIPVDAGGSRCLVEALRCGRDVAAGTRITRAATAPGEAPATAVEFLLGDESGGVLYRFTLPEAITTADFEPRAAAEPTVALAPQPAQMAALLRATLQQRRNTLAIMQDLAVPLGERTRGLVNLLAAHLSPRHIFQSQPVGWLQAHLKEHGRSFHAFTLTAMCLLLDMEAGRIAEADVQEAARGGRQLDVSWEALSQVARFEGEALDRKAWKARYEEAGLAFPERADASVFERMMTALALIEEQMGVRDTRSILRDLLRDSPSPRVEAVVRAWDALLQEEPETALQAQASGLDDFHAFLTARGVRMDPSTLLAFLLYAEIEAGRMTADHLPRWLRGRRVLAASAYAMRAVAAALDVSVLAVRPTHPDDAPLGLLALSPDGVLEGIERDDGSLTVYRRIQAPTPVEPGWRTNGRYLIHASVSADAAGAAFACYQGEADRQRCWKRLDAQHAPPRQIVRGMRVWQHDGRNLRAPVAEGLPAGLFELDLVDLIGPTEPAAPDSSRMDLLREALDAVLGSTHVAGPVLTDRGLRALRQNLDNPRVLQILRQVVEARTLEQLKTTWLNPDKPALILHIHEPVMQGLRHVEILDFACLALVYELIGSDHTGLQHMQKGQDRVYFRSALRNQLLTVLEATEPAVRALGCRLLTTKACVGDAGERPIVEYELKKHLGSDDAAVAQEAAASLARLALEDVVPLPALWHLRKPAATESAATSGELEPEVVPVMQEIREWQGRVASLLGSAVAASTPGAGGSSTLLVMARMIAATRTTFAREERAGQDVADYFVFVATDGFLKELLKAFLATWQPFAERQGLTLRDVAHRAAEALPAYLDFARSLEGAGRLWWPVEADAGGATAWAERVPVFPYRELSSPRSLWIFQAQPMPGRIQESVITSPLFHTLLLKALEHGTDNLRLCRIAGRAQRPVALDLEVLSQQKVAFCPFLEEMQLPARFFLEEGQHELLEALAGALKSAPAPRAAEGTAVEAARKTRLGADSREVRLAAARLIDSFSLSNTSVQDALDLIRHARLALTRP